jgi:hypothetical protein
MERENQELATQLSSKVNRLKNVSWYMYLQVFYWQAETKLWGF